MPNQSVKRANRDLNPSLHLDLSNTDYYTRYHYNQCFPVGLFVLPGTLQIRIYAGSLNLWRGWLS